LGVVEFVVGAGGEVFLQEFEVSVVVVAFSEGTQLMHSFTGSHIVHGARLRDLLFYRIHSLKFRVSP